MKVLMVKFRMGGGVNHRIEDAGKAKAAYEALREAMAKHREFGNDRDGSVEIKLDRGVASYRVGELALVVLDEEYVAGSVSHRKYIGEKAERLAAEEKALRAVYRRAGLRWPPTKIE